VGIVLQWERYSDYALALTVAVIFGTILALVLVTLLLKLLLRERGKAGQRGGRANG
jgi:holin-like protein